MYLTCSTYIDGVPAGSMTSPVSGHHPADCRLRPGRPGICKHGCMSRPLDPSLLSNETAYFYPPQPSLFCSPCTSSYNIPSPARGSGLPHPLLQAVHNKLQVTASFFPSPTFVETRIQLTFPAEILDNGIAIISAPWWHSEI